MVVKESTIVNYWSYFVFLESRWNHQTYIYILYISFLSCVCYMTCKWLWSLSDISFFLLQVVFKMCTSCILTDIRWLRLSACFWFVFWMHRLWWICEDGFVPCWQRYSFVATSLHLNARRCWFSKNWLFGSLGSCAKLFYGPFMGISIHETVSRNGIGTTVYRVISFFWFCMFFSGSFNQRVIWWSPCTAIECV